MKQTNEVEAEVLVLSLAQAFKQLGEDVKNYYAKKEVVNNESNVTQNNHNEIKEATTKDWKYRRIVYCNNCGKNSDVEVKYGKQISSVECPLCGCKTLHYKEEE